MLYFEFDFLDDCPALMCVDDPEQKRLMKLLMLNHFAGRCSAILPAIDAPKSSGLPRLS
eukprot:m.5568 g.5568  ORF g.5568 m.5568 type:complete len:59 (+) comp7799_c0_seq1:173-349(+)